MSVKLFLQIVNYFLKCAKQNIIQIREYILYQLYHNWKVGKIEGSTM